jgi:hypothetical protein
MMALLMASLPTACMTTHRGPTPAPARPSRAYADPYGYKLADPSCTQDSALKSVGKVNVWVYDKQWPEKMEFDLSEVSGYGLSSPYISVIKHGAVFERKVDKLNKSSAQPDREIITQENSGEPILICRKGGDYPYDSLENAALSAAVSVTRVGALLRSAKVPESIPRATIYVHPHYISVDKPDASYDNAYYQGNALYILAHSPRGLRTAFNGIPLSAQLAVVAHEYGHMINDALIKAGSAEVASWQELWSRADLNPVYEGVADLSAYYAFYAFDGPHDNLPHLRMGDALQNRNVASCSCDDGTFKVLSERYINRYFSGLGLVGPSPDPRDSHALGAILAYGFEHILDQVKNPPLSWVEKFKTLLKWERRLTNLAKSRLRNSPLLAEAISLGLEVIREDYGRFSPANCQNIREIYPLYFPAWIKKFPECHY